ncbi:MAG: DNA polymerase II [Desulfuromonadales bacterium]|nr:DNA polymerase II [Desulfuromonadales bacterium]
MLAHEIENSPLLFGHDKRTGIVAVEPAGHFVRLFFRTDHGVQFHDEPFQPFILARDLTLVTGLQVPCSVRRLEGEGALSFQLLFDSWADCLKARDVLSSKTGISPSAGNAPYQFISDLSHQYLLSSGTTLFKGIGFRDLHLLSLDIETYCAPGYTFSNPDRQEDRIISIACRDSHGQETVLRGDRMTEQEMLLALNDIFHRSDPDVIIGHNIFRFDLDYIGKRARRHGVKLNWGRNGSEPHITAASRWNLAERSFDYPRWDIYGRHVIDTYFLVQHYDLTQRTLESHGLKQVAHHFGVSEPDRVYLNGNDIAAQFNRDPELLYRYNLDDVRETAAIFNILGYPWFLQTQIFPYSFQNCPLRGNATRINALFLREYLRRAHAIPGRTTETTPFEGGYTELLREGIQGPIIHCDVASLYPSLMLAYCLKPSTEPLGLFLPMLGMLRNFRLEAKQAARESVDSEQRHYLETVQQVFKVLINSFFGYLGAPLHNFSDPAAAAEVTRLGRVTIKTMMDLLRKEGAEPVEVDTDGIYFRPPPSCAREDQQRELVERISGQLPKEIEVEMDGRYRSMFAYKSKNYALLGYDGAIIIRGSSLRSRGMEHYLREFMREAIELLLTSGGSAIEPLYTRYAEKLLTRNFPITWVARTETLNDTPAGYQAKVRTRKRNPSAAFEIAGRSERLYRAGDQVSYYISGSGKEAVAYENCRPLSDFDPGKFDINIPYYLDKLRRLKKRFEPFLPKEQTLFDF